MRDNILHYMTNHSNEDSEVSNLELTQVLLDLGGWLETYYSAQKVEDITFFLDDKTQTSLSESPHILIQNILSKVKKNVEDWDFISAFIDFQIKTLALIEIPDAVKINLLLSENVLDDFFKRIFFKDFEKGQAYFSVKINLLKRFLSVNNLSKEPVTASEPTIENFLFDTYFHLRNQITDHFIRHKNLSQCKDFLVKELESDNKKIVSDNFFTIIKLNDLFVFMAREDIAVLLEKYSDSIDNKQLERIKPLLLSAPVALPTLIYLAYTTNEFLVFRFPISEYGQVAPHLFFHPRNKVRTPEILNFSDEDISDTIIEFVIPFKIDIPEITAKDNKTSLYFKPIKNYHDHPFYHVVRGIDISKITLQHYLEMIEDKDNFTHVTIVLKGSFHPDFEIDNSSGKTDIINNFFKEEEEIYGNRYSPVKIYILKLLRDISKEIKLSLSLDESKLNADLFSSFSLKLIGNGLVLLEKYTFFTSLKVFERYTELYYDRLSQLNSYSREVIENFRNYEIQSDRSFLSFVVFMFEKFAINAIRGKSGYAYLWNDKSCTTQPKSEPEVQPYFLNVIESLCETKGVSVTREPSSASGNIDMLFSYTTSKNRLLKVCVEIKNAHHSNIVDGVKTQLVPYLNSQNANNGIYIVLWYKNGEGFKKPTKFKTKDNLFNDISAGIPEGYNIQVIVVDCTKPMSPSKIRAKDL